MSNRRRRSTNDGKQLSEPLEKRGAMFRSRKKCRAAAWKDDNSTSRTASVDSIGDDSRVHLGQDAAREAPWRVENIRANGAPSETEWWSGAATEDPSGDIRNVDGKSLDSASEECSEETNSGEFHNCGLETWKQVQAAWRVPTVSERPPAPPRVDRDRVRRGLSFVSRTFELPGPMKLADVIDIYTEVWD